jgi:hypothetical protein
MGSLLRRSWARARFRASGAMAATYVGRGQGAGHAQPRCCPTPCSNTVPYTHTCRNAACHSHWPQARLNRRTAGQVQPQRVCPAACARSSRGRGTHTAGQRATLPPRYWCGRIIQQRVWRQSKWTSHPHSTSNGFSAGAAHRQVIITPRLRAQLPARHERTCGSCTSAR